ncbi:MAG: peptidylprolyl isomerase [Timaviella obliquedivisa GSE-PSE-MK23-08B]|nr:peptidylprolyl isomerase [Timaviella obliquedivisa GSE-PSE-MK23-08B]
MKIYRWFTSLLLVGALYLGGCTTQSGGQAPAETPSSGANTISPIPNPVASASPTVAADQFSTLPRLEGEATVEMTVKGALISIDVDGTNAPITAGNFVDLVNRGVYNGLAFHRVVLEPQPFVAQGGDPQSKDASFPVERLGTGSFIDPATSLPRYIPLEIKPEGQEQPIYSQTFESAKITVAPKLQHTRGAVAMARSGDPDSASAQFYVALSDLDFLDGSYAVFGNVTAGMETVDQIQQGDRITSARVTKGIENLKPGQ